MNPAPTTTACLFGRTVWNPEYFSIPTWYGNPQFANETYGPRSTIRISACSSNLRRRAAHEAPPATPPTMITFIALPQLSVLAVYLLGLAVRLRRHRQ